MCLFLVLLRREYEVIWYDRKFVQHQKVARVLGRYVGDEELVWRVFERIKPLLWASIFLWFGLLREGRTVTQLELEGRLAGKRLLGGR